MDGQVLVFGAQGVLGRAVARQLGVEGWNVLRAGRRSENSSDFRLADLDRPETLRAAASETDLIVNCVLHREMPVERMVLREGGTLLTIASLDREQHVSLEREHPSPRGLVVQAGFAPGVTDIMLAAMLAELPNAERVDLASTHSAFQSAGKNAFDFFWPVLTRRAHRPTTTIPFPPPFGQCPCLELSSGEEGWLGEAPAGRSAHVWLCIRESALRTALLAANSKRALRFIPRPPGMLSLISRRGALSAEPKCVWIAVAADGRPRLVRTIEGRGDYRMTVAATVVFAEAVLSLRRRDASRKGLYWASELFALADLRPGLEARGVRFRQQVSRK